MTDKTWTVMNDLQEAFNEITTFSFLLEKLQEAVNANDTQRIVNTTAALNAFYQPYCDNWDDKFKVAWNHVINELNCEPCPPCDALACADHLGDHEEEL